ncbi:MAG: carboxylase [Bacteroidetes bacterium]|nr:carboxylase [Bacteroidota bacterium]
MKKRLLIRDVTLRDGQQSLFATRMNQDQVDRTLPGFKDAGFYALEVWGGAVPDSVMRYLHENPWARLEIIHKEIGDTSLLTALSRGRNLFGYNPYPDDVIEGFNRNAIRSGISIMRIFDALNDTDNIRSTVKFVKENGGIADCTVVYTVDPKYSTKEKLRALLHARLLPSHIFSKEYFLGRAKEFEKMGADMITVKDMAGLITPGKAGRLIRLLKQNISVPIDFHTHCTPGYGLASTLMAIVNGVDIVDTALASFAGGSAAPSFELIQLFCNRMDIDTGVNLQAVVDLDPILRDIRKELAEFDSTKLFPREFNILTDTLPRDIEQMFELAIAYAKADKEDDLLEVCHRIESWFGFPDPDDKIKEAEIPGGMYSNMLAQLKALKLEKLLVRAMELIPMVRLVSGCPPLVTPTSQIVGVQAVNCAIDEAKGDSMYTTKSIQFVNLVKGVYGHTPVPIDPEYRYKIAGVREETPYDTKYYRRQDNPIFEEYGGVRLARDEKEELLLELFPSVANDFLKKRVEDTYLAEIYRIEEEKYKKIEEEKLKYDILTPEQKEQRLLDGLYNYHWSSYTEDDPSIGHS